MKNMRLWIATSCLALPLLIIGCKNLADPVTAAETAFIKALRKDVDVLKADVVDIKANVEKVLHLEQRVEILEKLAIAEGAWYQSSTDANTLLFGNIVDDVLYYSFTCNKPTGVISVATPLVTSSNAPMFVGGVAPKALSTKDFVKK